MTMQQLLEENNQLRAENFELRFQLEQLRKAVFGKSGEGHQRTVPQDDPSKTGIQGSIFTEKQAEQDQPSKQEDTTIEVKAYKKKKKESKKRVKSNGRNPFPASLKRDIEEIYPENYDEEKMIVIGQDVSESLEYKEAEIAVKRRVRYRVAYKGNEDKGVLQAAPPPKLIPKSKVEDSVIAKLITEKILFHTPLYRFRKKLKQAGITFITSNDLNNWFHKTAEALLPLYYILQDDLLSRPYNQADETTLKVLCKNKPGTSHRGFMWVLYNTESKASLFHYSPSRSSEACLDLIKDYKGILQADGYEVYDSLQKSNGFKLIFCMAHARRKFYDAMDSASGKASYFLDQVQDLYRIEEKCRKENLLPEDRLKVRKAESIPILEKIGKWLSENQQSPDAQIKSPINTAIQYAAKRWEGLCAYAHDGRLEIDNNLIENSIRPLALGRKNYLFAGSHDAARNLAALYSIVSTAHKNGLNVYRYLCWLFKKVSTEKITQQAVSWLPYNLSEEQTSHLLAE